MKYLRKISSTVYRAIHPTLIVLGFLAVSAGIMSALVDISVRLVVLGLFILAFTYFVDID